MTFLDTAGIRETSDLVEGIGIDRSRDRALNADLRVFVGEIPEDMLDHKCPGDLEIHTKGDLTGRDGAVSSVTGEGIDTLLSEIFEELRERVSETGLASHARQADALSDAARELAHVSGHEVEIVSEHLRAASHHLQRLIGRIDVEDYLDRVFSRFCIGK